MRTGAPQASDEPRRVEAARKKLPGNHARDPQNVQNGPEITAPRAFGVGSSDRRIHDTNATATRFNQNLALEYEPRVVFCALNERSKQSGGIDPETGLTVSNRLTGCPGNPEIRETVGEVAIQRDGFTVVKPRSDDNC